MEALIRREGGDPFVAPSVQERALEDDLEAVRFMEQIESGAFDLLICMTGVGLAFWRDQVAKHAAVDRLGAALRMLTIISRGPKPLPVLRELGVRADLVVPEPNTWKEIVGAVAERPERRIAVQEYGRPNLEMNAALEKLGASVSALVVYRWELPEDSTPLRTAARRLANHEIDVVLFTSSIQLDHLMMVARGEGLEAGVTESLRNFAVIASVGPVMTASLEASGLPVDIVPMHPKMAALVKAAAELSASHLLHKSGRR
jgi:uroporphyrinogen-III synthase